MSDQSRLAVSDPASAEDLAAAKRLCQDYAESLGFSLSFDGFDEEMASFPAPFAPPGGALLLARLDDRPVGIIALRPLGRGAAELKRMYVAPVARGLGLGRMLAEAVIDRAAELGHHTVRLDTLPSMDRAITLFRNLGFVDDSVGGPSLVDGAVFLELSLGEPLAA